MAGYISAGRYYADTLVSRKPPLTLAAAKAKLVLPLSRDLNKDGAPPAPIREDDRTEVQTLGDLVAKGKLEEAVDGLEAAIRKRDLPALHNNLGVAHELSKDPGNAAREYAVAVRMAPKVALYRENLSRALTLIGNLRRSVAEGEAAVKLAPTWTFARTTLAETYTFVGRFDAALVLARSIAATETKWHPLAVAANVLSHIASGVQSDEPLYARYIAEAETLYRRALELEPHQYDVLVNFSGMLLTSGKTGQARILAQDAVRTKPDESDGWVILALCESRLDHPKEAETAYKQALRQRPTMRLSISTSAIFCTTRGVSTRLCLTSKRP